jgi:hypothetical protein
MTADKFAFRQGHFARWRLAFQRVLCGPVKSKGMTQEAGWAKAYERRMRIFNLGVILTALSALAILLTCFFSAWGAAFPK